MVRFQLLIIILFCCGTMAKPTIQVASSKTVHKAFRNWNSVSSCGTRENYHHVNATRGSIELALICRAFALVNANLRLEVIDYPNYSRALEQVRKGRVHMAAESIWSEDISFKWFYSSSAVLADGDFKKRVYFHDSNRYMTKNMSWSKIKNKTAVLPKGWRYDWQVLESMGVKVVSAPHTPSMLEMLQKGRADFTLLEANNSNNSSISFGDITLYAVNNVLVDIPGTRHFVVSKQARYSKEIFSDFDKGLQKLIERGEVRRAYEQAGFLPSQGDGL